MAVFLNLVGSDRSLKLALCVRVLNRSLAFHQHSPGIWGTIKGSLRGSSSQDEAGKIVPPFLLIYRSVGEDIVPFHAPGQAYDAVLQTIQVGARRD